MLFGAFKIGELVSPSKQVHRGMWGSGLQCTDDAVSLVLQKSKTDHLGRNKVVQIFPIHGSPLCPVGAFRGFLEVHPAVSGSFLLHADGSPLSRYQFVSVFRKCLRALGLKEKEVFSHSFRIGAAMEAARCGMDA